LRSSGGRERVEPREILRQGLDTLGLPSDEGTIAQFMTYLAELKKWNRAYSITALRDDMDVVVSHFLDSALYMAGLDESVRSVADIGSGGGFPGVPMRILRPELEVYLIEPNRKKASFLRSLLGRLGLRDVRVHESRMEQLSGITVDAVVTRALFSVHELYEGASGIVGEGGRLILSKGPKYEEELRELEIEYEVLDIALPFSDAVRHIIILKT
jgi:16S rRNA (guanine527-N7)-methyltransferase